MVNQISMLNKIAQKVEGTSALFEFFMQGDWRYENKKIYKLINLMSQEERLEFQCDCKSINWEQYIDKYFKGLGIWVLK